MRKVLILLLLAAFLPGSEHNITVIKNPKANIIEKPAIPLKHVRTIPLRLANNVFNIDPISATADGDGNIYLYDKFICQVRKLDKNDNLLSTIDINSAYKSWQIKKTRRPAFIQYSRNHGLYVYDPMMTTLLRYNKQGKLIERFEKVPFINRIVVSPDGGVLLPEFIENDLVFKCLGKKNVLFRINDYKHEFLFFKQEGAYKFPPRGLFLAGSYFLYLDRDRILIFSIYSSRLILLNKSENVTSNKLLCPKEALDSFYHELLLRKKETFTKVIPFYFNPFFNLNEKLLYVQSRIKTGKSTWGNYIYVFDICGTMNHRLVFDDFKNKYINFLVKNDQEYWVLVNKKIYIFKEET